LLWAHLCAVLEDKENEQQPVACKLNFVAASNGPLKGKALGVLTPSKANNVARKRGVSMLVTKPDVEVKRARHSMFPEGTPSLPSPQLLVLNNMRSLLKMH
jgi:hypothetical protein